MMDRVAKTVVIDPRPNYRFDVDGKDFPWYISERGPIVTQVDDELFTVGVEIFLIDRDTHDDLTFDYGSPRSGFNPPILGGREFPWLLTEDECVFTFASKVLPTLRLKFFAEKVTGDWPVDDQREKTGDVYATQGVLMKAAVPQRRELIFDVVVPAEGIGPS